MSWGNPHFDSWQFAHRPHAVSAESRISYEDFRTMHISGAVVQRERRLSAPAWAAGTALREIVLTYLERRLFLPPSTAPMPERLDAIQRTAESIAAAKMTRLQGYLREYATLVKQPDGPETAQRLRGLERQITTLDGEVALLRRGLAATVSAIVYLFHRASWDGAQIAEHLGLTKLHVRQVLHRLNRAATTPGRIRRTRTQQRQNATRAKQLGIPLKELRRRQKMSAGRKGKCMGNKFSSRPRSAAIKLAISLRLRNNKNAVGHRGFNGRHRAQEATGGSR